MQYTTNPSCLWCVKHRKDILGLKLPTSSDVVAHTMDKLCITVHGWQDFRSRALVSVHARPDELLQRCSEPRLRHHFLIELKKEREGGGNQIVDLMVLLLKIF
jgi:hypothetical protein